MLIPNMAMVVIAIEIVVAAQVCINYIFQLKHS